MGDPSEKGSGTVRRGRSVGRSRAEEGKEEGRGVGGAPSVRGWVGSDPAGGPAAVRDAG